MTRPLAPFLEGEHIQLRALDDEDVGPAYLSWLSDRLGNRYLESRYRPPTLAGLRQWVAAQNASSSELLFGIFLRDAGTEGAHVGNIKLGGIDRVHRRGDIGLLIGDRDSWGKGIATEAIGLVTRFAFDQLGLNKVTASCYEPNEGSRRAFLKAGFVEEGRRLAHFFCDGQFVDCIQLARIHPGAPGAPSVADIQDDPRGTP